VTDRSHREGSVTEIGAAPQVSITEGSDYSRLG